MFVPGVGMAQANPLTKQIPSTSEALTMVELGSWINVGNDAVALESWGRFSMPAAGGP
jgi:hypothetical protein